jgi:hypothetical protein
MSPAVLIGKPPAAFRPSALPLDLAPPDISAGLPSEPVERRADIAAAERRVAEANDQIGIARAAYYPTVMLVLRRASKVIPSPTGLPGRAFSGPWGRRWRKLSLTAAAPCDFDRRTRQL